MSDQDAYIALISSLPGSERLFVAKQPPLSRLRLDRRLKALTSKDARVLRVLEDTLNWSAYDMEVTDAQAVLKCKQALSEVKQPTLRKLLIERLDLRTVVAALRLRGQGGHPPAGAYGFGRWSRHIPANWSDPDFRLAVPMPWIKDARQLLEAQDPLGLERLLLSVSHKQLKRHAARHMFDFEAVAIYVLIWNIFDRWAQSNAQNAATRFEKLAQQAMANVADFDFERESA